MTDPVAPLPVAPPAVPPAEAGKRPGRGKGCAWGCGGCVAGFFGCLAMLAALLWLVLGYPAKKYEKWSGFPGSLDKLRPGMTVEEARAVFLEHCTFEEKEENRFLSHTWVVSPEAVPVHVLRVEAGEPPTPLLIFGCFLAHFSSGANLYFDGEGKLVGVHENAWEDGTWKAPWGVLHE